MPKGSAELTNSRREEIIAACRKLFQSMSYKEITIKEIAEETSFTRPSIYNYFETKEEIFLALFQKEYESFFLNDTDFHTRFFCTLTNHADMTHMWWQKFSWERPDFFYFFHRNMKIFFNPLNFA